MPDDLYGGKDLREVDRSVLFVVRPAAGGIRKHVSTLATHLPPRGCTVALAAPFDFALDAPISVRRHTVPITARTYPLLDLMAARQVSRLARDVDLLHGHGLRGAWIAALASRMSGTPFVFTAHNLLPASPGRLARLSLRYIARRASAVICVSSAVAEGLRPYSPSRIEVIPNGIDVAAYEGPVDRAAVADALRLPAAALEPDARWVVGVGRLSPEKGFDTFVQIAHDLRELYPDWHFILAGDGPERGALEEEIESSSLTRFYLPGYVRDVPALLRAADVVIIPSREEGQGIVALEAMAAGTPVIASAVGGLPETIEQAGVLVSPPSYRAFEEECENLLVNPPRMQDMVQKGRQRVTARFTLNVMIERTEQLYHDVKVR